jgi:tRNA-dependent cyclodipeptide synthase
MQIVDTRFFPHDFPDRWKDGKAIIGISLNNQVSKSSLLLQQLFNWTREHRGAFDLLVGDYMNRHNYQAFNAASKPDAERKAVSDGSKATVMLRKLLDECGSEPVSVISATSLYMDATFGERLAYFNEVYATNKAFSDPIHEAIGAFLARKPDVIVTKDIRRHCVAYQLEELVLFELLARDGYRSLVYAGAQLPIMKSIVCGNIDGISDLLKALNLVEIKFSRTQ